MKKGLIGIGMLLLLSGCQQNLKIEENAQLNVAVANVEYGEKLTELWNETYPENRGALTITVLEENEILEAVQMNQSIEYDLFYVKDSEVGGLMEELYELPSKFENRFEIKINPEFSDILDKVKQVYYAMEANGFFYAVDMNQLADKELDLESFASFEQLSKIENSFYYMDTPTLTTALLSSDVRYFPGKNHNTLELDGAPFRTSLTNYLSIRNMMKFKSNPASFDNWFIHQNYISGLIAPWMQADANEEINGAEYKYLPLPTIDGKPLSTLATSYGYVINADTQYPEAAKKCLELMHSVSGMQILADTTKQVPLVLEEQMDQLTYKFKHQEEKVLALNFAVQNSLVGLAENETVGAIDFLEEETTIQLINACSSEDIQGCLNNIHEAYNKWIKEITK